VVGANGVVTCTGDQSNGVSLGPPTTTLTVGNLSGPIDNQPSSGFAIRLFNESGQTLTINSGTTVSAVNIEAFLGAGGIAAISTGTRGPDGVDACNLCTGTLSLEGRSSTDGGDGGAGGFLSVNASRGTRSPAGSTWRCPTSCTTERFSVSALPATRGRR
jgi:hypothetical protein